MIHNLINAIYYSFLFYVFYSVFHRVEIKKYIKKSTQNSTYSESYKTMYNKYLKSNRILMGCFRFAEDYTNTIFSMAIGIVVILCLKPIFEKYYPKPKGNL